jgi:hydroxypyruvate reductase
MAELASRAGERDLVICLISGGGSALLPLPVAGITLADKQKTTARLLECGADITEINTIRKHLSQLKGGQLARLAAPATLLTLVLSDVIGDPLTSIASGPTVGDPTTFSDCRAIVEKYRLADRLPPAVYEHIEAGAAGRRPETPKPDDPLFARVVNRIVASSRQAVDAAAAAAREHGYQPLILSTFIEGETREIARMHAAIAREATVSGNPAAPPACIISGGETTVTIRGKGKGGATRSSCWRRHWISPVCRGWRF